MYYKLEELADIFSEHEKEVKAREHGSKEFNLPRALKTIVQELIELKAYVK